MAAVNTPVPASSDAGEPYLPLRSGAAAVLNGDGTVAGWTSEAERLLGHRSAEVVGRPGAELLDGTPANCSIAGLGPGEGWAGQVPMRHRDGRRVEVGLSISPLFQIDERDRRLVFALVDPQQPSSAITASVLERFLSHAPIGIAVLDPDLKYIWMNDTLVRLGGLPREQRLGHQMKDSLPGVDTRDIEARVRQVFRTGEPLIDYEYQGWTHAHPGQLRSFSTSFFRLADADGNVLGVCYMSMDVTDRWQARERLALVGEAGARIGSTLGIARTAQELADLAVPRLADFVAVDLLDSVLEGEEPLPCSVSTRPAMRRVGLRSVRDGAPEAVAGVGEPVNVIPPMHDGRYLIHGEPLLVPVLHPTKNPWSVEQPTLAAKIREFGLHSMMAVPLRARGVVLGLATFLRSTDPASFEPDDLLLAEELAARAALCVDNARRYTREHTASLTLQRSLLPHNLAGGTAMEVASRYLPAARHGVGGDWFDVIPLSGARVALVVGDVAGHGIAAAAAMGRLRTAVQTLADMDLPPDEVLAHLDDLVLRLTDELSEDQEAATAVLGATCLYAVYDPVAALCTMARAGHPPPALVTPDGSVTFPDLPAGPPLGLGAMPFESDEFELAEGSVIALYTDGLLRSRDQDIDAGLNRLSRALAQTRLSLEELCTSLVEGLPTGPQTDDIALLLARTGVLTDRQVAAWDIPPDPAEVSHVRSMVARQLDLWELEELQMTTELVVSEMVTNAIRYAPGPIRLRLIRHSVLTCEVFDSGNTAPHLRHARTTDEGGRGLFLVAQLTHRWGSRFTSGGKLIWADQAIPAPSGGPSPGR